MPAWPVGPGSTDADPESFLGTAPDDVLAIARRLQRILDSVTGEEFRWQDQHYNRDSRYGRELLYLIADNGWVRATSEIVDITRSDSVDTAIKIEIDIDRITHEAFHVDTERIWLPLLVLPAPKRRKKVKTHERRRRAALYERQSRAGHHIRDRLPRRETNRQAQPPGEPDPFATLTVTDAGGQQLAMVPNVDVRHWISAAMAEIIVNMAVARWADGHEQRPTATRDQRLLLSAGIYRLLHSGPAEPSSADSPDSRPPDSPPRSAGTGSGGTAVDLPAARAPGATPLASGRLSSAKAELNVLLGGYVRDYAKHVRARRPAGTGWPTGDGEPATTAVPRPRSSRQRGSKNGRGMGSIGHLLAERAGLVLNAFAQATVVVVAVDRDQTPTVLTVGLPTRRLHRNRESTLGRPRAELQIDLVVPSADADRQIQVNLPDGVSYDGAGAAASAAEMVIEVEPPKPIEHLTALMTRLLGPGTANLLPPIRQCLADLATVKVEVVNETLRQHLIGHPGNAAADLHASTRAARRKLGALRTELDLLSNRPDDRAALRRVRSLWDEGRWLQEPLRRRTLANTLSPRAVVARAGVIEDAAQRATASHARIDVRVEVTDAEFFSVARFAGVMSILLMTVVLAFLAIKAPGLENDRGVPPSPEVLAGALTLFSAIQAGRIEHQDRSTLRGLLSAAGNWLIVASILPTVVLAVALAFNVSGWTPVAEAGGAIIAQLMLQFVMWRGPLSSTGASGQPPRQLLRTEPAPDYARIGVLQSDWWCSTTADALKIGRQAHAYVVWEHDGVPSLPRLLVDARQASPPAAMASRTAARRLLSRLGLQPHSASLIPQARMATAIMESPAGGSGPADEPVDRTAVPPGRPANILALMRSGTAAQALTFVVFREEPANGWARGANPYPVALDPDRLAPHENVPDIVEIFLSTPRVAELPPLASHPLTSALAAAADYRLTVIDAQLPVPAPSAAYTDRTWARLRVGMHDAEIRRLPAFLHATRRRIHTNATVPPSDIWVRTAPERGLRIILPTQPPRTAAGSCHVLASDIDVLTAARSRNHYGNAAPNWRVLAMCANARAGIESDILHELGRQQPDLRLAGLTSAVLHGTAVILMLGHQPERRPAQDTGLSTLTERHADAHLEILVDQWQTPEALGRPGPEPLLRVHIHAQDQPGTLLDLLTSLHATLREALPNLPPDDTGVWHVLTHGTATDATRLTVRLAVPPREVADWDRNKFAEIERITRERAAHAAALRRSASPADNKLGAPEDTVISISLITASAETPDYTRRWPFRYHTG